MANKDMKIVVSADTKKAEQNLNKLDNGIKETAKSIALATASMYAAKKSFDFIGSSTRMAIEQEKTFRTLQSAIELTGKSYSKASSQLNNLFNELQRTTVYGDTETARVLQQLITLTGDYEGSIKNLPIVLDMASSGLFDVNTAARYVGMAMSGNIEMLGRYIPELKASNNEHIKLMNTQEKAAYAMDILREKFAGFAEKELQTTAGQIKQLENYWGDLKESLGDVVLPAITPLVKIMRNAILALTGRDIVEDAERQKQITYNRTFEMFKNKTAEQRNIALQANNDQRQSILTAINTFENYGEILGDTYNESVALAKSYGLQTYGLHSNINIRNKVIEGLKNELLNITQANNALTTLKESVADLTLLQQMQAAAPKIKVEVEALFDIPEDENIKVPEFIDPETTKELIAADKALITEYNTWKQSGRENELAKLQEFYDNGIISHEEYVARKKEIDLEYNQFAQAGIDTLLAGYTTFINSLIDMDMTGKERREAIWEAIKQSGISAISAITSEMLRQLIVSKIIGKQQKKSAIGRATGNTAEAVTKTLASVPFPANLAAAAVVEGIGATQIGVVSAAKYARGGDFVTNGPELIMVGDNPGGKERVTVTPTSSPNYDGPNNNAIVERLDMVVNALANLPIYNITAIDDIELSRRNESGTLKRSIL